MLRTIDYKKRYIVTNFAYGTGPYLRATNLAISLNLEFEKREGRRMGIIVPWLYDERQKKVMLEEFSEHEKKYPGEIVLDRELGALYKKVFYGTHSYEDALTMWVDRALLVSREAKHYLEGTLLVETLSGEERKIKGGDIALELNRSPRLSYGVAPSYYTSFASLEDILESASKIKEIATSKKLLLEAAEIACAIERGHEMYAIATPATFSFRPKHTHFRNEISVPPIAPLPKVDKTKMDPGIFVTVTGIPGLERLYSEAKTLGLKLYSNDTEAVQGSVHALPYIVGNENIKLHFARAGWSSVWRSLVVGTPLVVPEYDATDDPEIYFNNKSVEELGLGLVYRGEALGTLLEKSKSIVKNYAKIRTKLLKQFGTLDGNTYCAKIFVEHFLDSREESGKTKEN